MPGFRLARTQFDRDGSLRSLMCCLGRHLRVVPKWVHNVMDSARRRKPPHTDANRRTPPNATARKKP
eukprot:15353367-Alexandrium_andersonii.AAC.1